MGKDWSQQIMNPENKARILVAGTPTGATIYNAVLKTGRYETRLFTYTEETHSRQSSQSCSAVGEILELASDFRPHLIVLNYDVDVKEFLVRIDQAFSKSEKPLTLLTVPKDAWFEEVDACITMPVDPEVFLQTVRDLLQKKPR
jgi:hypothetical protein